MEEMIFLTLLFGFINLIVISLMVYWLVMHKGGIRMRIQATLMGDSSADVRRAKKVEKIIKSDLQDFIINRNPELVHNFPKTLALAKQNPDWVDSIATGLTRVLGTFFLRGALGATDQTALIGQSLRATDMEQTLVKQGVKSFLNFFLPSGKKAKDNVIAEEKEGKSKNVI